MRGRLRGWCASLARRVRWAAIAAHCRRLPSARDLPCSEELERKICISTTKIEETRVKLTGLDEATATRARVKAERAVEHRLDVLVGRVNTVVSTAAWYAWLGGARVRCGMAATRVWQPATLPEAPSCVVQSKHNEGLRAKIESLRKDKQHRARVLRQLEREAAMARERLQGIGIETAAANEAKVQAERESAALQATMMREGARFEADLMDRVTVRSV